MGGKESKANQVLNTAENRVFIRQTLKPNSVPGGVDHRREGMGSAPIFHLRKKDLNLKKQGLSVSTFLENVICYTFKVLMKDLLKER